MVQILAQADFKVTGVSKWSGKSVDTTVHFELYKSGAFDYGNGTGMSMQFKGNMEQCYDTRYEPDATPENFQTYAYEFLQGYLADELTAEPIK